MCLRPATVYGVNFVALFTRIKCIWIASFYCCRACWLNVVLKAKIGMQTCVLSILTHWPLKDVALISKVYKYIVQNSSKGIRCENVLGWMPQSLTNESATLVQAWRHQAIIWTNVNPNLWHQIYGVTRPQCFYVTLSHNYPLCRGQLHYVQLLYTAFVIVLKILNTITSCEYRSIC